MPVLAIVEKMVLWKRLLIPIYVLPVLWAVSVFLALNAFFLQKQNPDYAILYTLSLASSAAFLAAGIGMWTYGFINRQSQDRGFNRDIEVRYFEEIYGPLYEELSRVANELKGNDWPTLVQWPRIAKSRFGPVVDGTVNNLFVALSYRLADYSAHSKRYWDAGTRCIQLVMTGNADLDGVSSQTKDTIVLALEEDRRFIFDDSVTAPRDSGFHRLEASLKDVIPDYKREDAEDFIKRLKPVLRADPLIAEHTTVRDGLYESTTKLRAIVLERMRPFHET